MNAPKQDVEDKLRRLELLQNKLSGRHLGGVFLLFSRHGIKMSTCDSVDGSRLGSGRWRSRPLDSEGAKKFGERAILEAEGLFSFALLFLVSRIKKV